MNAAMKAATVIATVCAAAVSPAFAETPDVFLEYVESTGTQFVPIDVMGRTGTRVEIVIGGLGGSHPVLLGSRSSAGYITWNGDDWNYPCMGYENGDSWGLNRSWGNLYVNGKGTLTSQISPLELTLDFNGTTSWYSDGYNPN